MPEVISLKGLKPDEIKIESQPETISLADLGGDIKIEHEVRPRETLSEVESAGRGALQGASFGFSDEIIGGVKGAYNALTSDKSFKDAYRSARDEERAKNDAARVDNPNSYFAGNVGGSLISLPLGGGLGAAGKIGAAAAQGALTGAGLSDTDTTRSAADVDELVKDTVIGGTIGAASQYGLSKLGQAFASLAPEKLRRFAEEKAVKAAGAMKRDFNDLQKSGELHKVGRDLLDKKIVTLFASLDDINERSGALKEAAGTRIGTILKDADDLVVSAEKLIDEGKLLGFLPTKDQITKAGVSAPTKEQAKEYLRDTFQASMARIGDRIKKELIDPNVGEPALKNEVKKLSSLAEEYMKLPGRSLEAANRTKSILGKTINFESETIPQAFKKQVYGIIRDEIDDTVGKIGNLEAAISQSGANLDDILRAKLSNLSAEEQNKLLSSAFSSAKRDYRTAATVQDIAQSRLGAQQSNRGVSLTDYIAGSIGGGIGASTAGGLVGGVPGAIALGALNKFARKHGATTQAVAADKLAQILERSPNALGEFGNLIEASLKEGPLALLTTHRMLMKDPNYERILLNFEPEARGLRLPEQRKGLSLPQGR